MVNRRRTFLRFSILGVFAPPALRSDARGFLKRLARALGVSAGAVVASGRTQSRILQAQGAAPADNYMFDNTEYVLTAPKVVFTGGAKNLVGPFATSLFSPRVLFMRSTTGTILADIEGPAAFGLQLASEHLAEATSSDEAVTLLVPSRFGLTQRSPDFTNDSTCRYETDSTRVTISYTSPFSNGSPSGLARVSVVGKHSYSPSPRQANVSLYDREFMLKFEAITPDGFPLIHRTKAGPWREG